MSSSFKGKNLFGSGPHRFWRGRQGQMLIPDVELGSYTPKSNPFGLVELEVIVRGRLLAGGESALWELRDDIADELLDPPTAGTLIDLTGRSYADMSFVRFDEAQRTDRGRVYSLAYTARFRRLIP
ncbi:MAG: hypothetical protein IT435_10350 [Phycisphaerales bacterium]|nr:hypothetical protein [Phycisphaerales bacterium]